MSVRDGSSPKVAVVGAGFVGREHAVAVQRAAQSLGLPWVPEDNVVVDIVGERARNIAREAGWRAGTIEDLLERPVSLVVVATPPAAHAEVVLALADTGCKFLVEKPLAPTRREALRMSVRAPQICVGLSQRFLPAVSYMRRTIAAGELGAVTSVTSQYEVCQLPSAAGTDWRLDPRQGLGVLGDIGCHAIDLIHFTLGDVIRPRGASVFCRPPLGGGTPGNDDAVSCTFTLEGGGIGSLHLSRVSPGRSKPRQSLRVVGERATLEWCRSELDIVRNERASGVTMVDVTYGDSWVVQGQRTTPWSEQFFLQMRDALQWATSGIRSETLATFKSGFHTLNVAIEFAVLAADDNA